MAESSAMTCTQAEELLSGLLDERLEPLEHAAILRHLLGCERCRATLTALRANAEALGELREVAVPAGFVRAVEARLPQPARRSIVARLFIPWQVKVPIQAAALVLLAVGSVLLFRSSPEMGRAVREAERFQAPAAPPVSESKEKLAAPGASSVPTARDQVRPSGPVEAGRPTAEQQATGVPADRLKEQPAPAPSGEARRADEADAKRGALETAPAAEPKTPGMKQELRSIPQETGETAAKQQTQSASSEPVERRRTPAITAEPNAPEPQKDLRAAREEAAPQRDLKAAAPGSAVAPKSALRQEVVKAAVASIRLRVPNSIEAGTRLREGLPSVGAEVAPGSGEPLQIVVPAGRYDAFLALLRTVGDIEGAVPPTPASPDASVRLTIRLLSR